MLTNKWVGGQPRLITNKAQSNSISRNKRKEEWEIVAVLAGTHWKGVRKQGPGFKTKVSKGRGRGKRRKNWKRKQ